MSNSSRNFKRKFLARQIDSREWPFTGNLGSVVGVPFIARLKLLFFGKLEIHSAFYLNKMAKVGPGEVVLYCRWPLWVEKIKAKIVKRLRGNLELPAPDGPPVESLQAPINILEHIEQKRVRGKIEVN